MVCVLLSLLTCGIPRRVFSLTLLGGAAVDVLLPQLVTGTLRCLNPSLPARFCCHVLSQPMTEVVLALSSQQGQADRQMAKPRFPWAWNSVPGLPCFL